MPLQKSIKVEEIIRAQHVFVAVRIDHPQKESIVAQGLE